MPGSLDDNMCLTYFERNRVHRLRIIAIALAISNLLAEKHIMHYQNALFVIIL